MPPATNDVTAASAFAADVAEFAKFASAIIPNASDAKFWAGVAVASASDAHVANKSDAVTNAHVTLAVTHRASSWDVAAPAAIGPTASAARWDAGGAAAAAVPRISLPGRRPWFPGHADSPAVLTARISKFAGAIAIFLRHGEFAGAEPSTAFGTGPSRCSR